MAKLNFTKTRFRKPLTVGQKTLCGLLLAAITGICFRDADLLQIVRSFDFKALLELARYDGGRCVFMLVMMTGLMFFATVLGHYRTQIDGAKRKPKSNPSYCKVFDKVTRHEIKLPVLRPNAWRALSESLNCMIVKVPDRRRAVWKMEKADEKELTLSATLLYTPEPIGRKRGQMYPRLLRLNARVEGFGVSSKLYLTYSADSPLDLVAVSELIQKTNEVIVSHMMAAETAPACLPEFADSASQLVTADSSDLAHPLGYTFSNQMIEY